MKGSQRQILNGMGRAGKQDSRRRCGKKEENEGQRAMTLELRGCVSRGEKPEKSLCYCGGSNRCPVRPLLHPSTKKKAWWARTLVDIWGT